MNESSPPPKWVELQRKGFTKWVNAQLVKRDHQICIDGSLEAALADGVRLPILIEELKNQKIFKKPKISKESRFQQLASLHTVMDHLRREEGLSLVNISAEDIYDQNTKLCLGLVWTLICHFQIEMALRDSADTSGTSDKKKKKSNKQSDKKVFLTMLNDVYIHRNMPPISNFDRDFSSPTRFYCLLNHLRDCTGSSKKREEDFASLPDVEQFAVAFKAAEDEFEIPQLLDPLDMTAQNPDELVVLTYLSYFIREIKTTCPDGAIPYSYDTVQEAKHQPSPIAQSDTSESSIYTEVEPVVARVGEKTGTDGPKHQSSPITQSDTNEPSNHTEVEPVVAWVGEKTSTDGPKHQSSPIAQSDTNEPSNHTEVKPVVARLGEKTGTDGPKHQSSPIAQSDTNEPNNHTEVEPVVARLGEKTSTDGPKHQSSPIAQSDTNEPSNHTEVEPVVARVGEETNTDGPVVEAQEEPTEKRDAPNDGKPVLAGAVIVGLTVGVIGTTMVSQGHGPASADREDDLCVVDTHSDDGNDRPVEYPIANNRSSVDKLKLQASSSSGGDESSDSDSEHESVGVKKSSGKKAKKTKTGEKPKTGTAEKTNTAEKFKTAKKKKNANIEPSSVKASAADTVLPAEVGRPKSESSADESNSGGATSSSSSSGDSSETNDSDSDSDSDQESVDDKKSAENKTKKAKTAKTTKTTKKVANAHGEESSVEAKAANTLLSAESQPNEVGGDDVSAALGHDDVPPEVMQHNLGKGVAAGGGGAAVVTATANNASDEAPQAQPNVGHSGRDNSAQAESVDDAGEIKDEVCGQGDIVHRRSTGAVTNNDGAGTASDSDATSHKSDHSIRSDRATSNSTMSTHRASNKIVKRTSDALTDSSSSSDSSDDEDMTGKDAEYIRMKEHRHNVRVRQYRSEIVALRAEHAAIQAARREDLNVQKDYTSDLSSSSSRDSSSDELSYAEGRSLVARLRRKVARGKAKLSASRMSRKMSKEGEITHVESGVHRTDSTPKASKSSSLGSAGADTHADAVKGEEKIQLSDGKVVAVSAVDGRKADLEVKLNRGEINVPLERYSPDSVQGEHKYKPAGVVVVGAVKTAAAASIPADDYVDVSDVPDGTGNEVADDRVVDSDVSDINGSADVSVELSAEGEAGHSTEEVVDAEKNIAVSASPSGSQTKSDGDMCPNPTKMDGVDVEVLRVAIAKLQVEYRAIQVTLDEYEQMEDEYLEAMNSCGDNGDEASRLTELAQKLKRLMLGAKARLMGSNGGRQSIPARKGVDHHSEDREADEVSHRAEGVAVGVGATIVAGAVSAQKHHGTDQRNGKTKETRSTEQQTDTAANTQNGVTGRSDKDKRDSPVQGHVKENVEAVTGDLKGVASDSKISPSEMLVHVMSGLEDVPVMDAETETNLRDSSPPFERLDLMAYENSTAGTPSPQTQDVAEIGAMVDSLRTEHNKLLASQARFCEDVSELQATEQVQIETGSFCSNTDSGTEKTLERRRDQLKRKIARGRARWAAQRAMKAEAKAEKQMASNTTPYRGSGGVSQASTSSTVDTQSGGNKSDGVETLQGSGQRGSREGGAEGNASAIDSIAPEVAPSKLAQDEGVIASEEYVSGKERNEPLPGDSSVSSLRSMVASLRVEHASLKILHEQRAAAAVAESSKPDPVQHNGTVQARNTTSSDSSSGSGEESYLRRIFHHMKKKITHVKEKRQRAKEAKVIERVSTVGKSGPSSKVGSKGGMVADAGGS